MEKSKMNNKKIAAEFGFTPCIILEKVVKLLCIDKGIYAHFAMPKSSTALDVTVGCPSDINKENVTAAQKRGGTDGTDSFESPSARNSPPQKEFVK